MGWFASWMLNPLMLGIGGLAIASPIIIHLLNRRRFKIVEWAAMRFLLDADKKNRKRIRIENLILLLLRCLAMILLGLMISRPFLPSAIGDLLGDSRRFERIVILDDSLSQQVVVDNNTQFELAKADLLKMVNHVAHDENVDFLTVYLTSRPTKPIMTNEPVTPETVAALIDRFEKEVKCSDEQAQYQETLQEVQRYVGDEASDINRMVFVLSDLRKVDWASPEQLLSATAPNKLINELTEQVSQVSVVDVGADVEANLAIIDVRPEDLLVANTVVGFSVTVANFGETAVKNVQVRFSEGENQALTETIELLAAGETETVVFRYLFQVDMRQFEDVDLQDRLQANRLNYEISAEIVHDGSSIDYLAADSEHFFAARVLQGIPILVVDGEPSPIPERSEAFFLEKIGVDGTGLLVDVVTVSELASVSLSKYKVIFLCNVDEASTDRITSLKQWVSNGGGLVFMPGSLVRANRFNDSFYREGEGLSPLKLIAQDGYPAMEQWKFFEVTDANHPALRVTKDRDIDLGKVQIFSWWDTAVKPEQLGKDVAVVMRLTNDGNSPALAERSVGEGRVMTFSIPADGDWTVWPAHPTYICVMWDLINYLVGGEGSVGSATVGNPISYPIDLSRYNLRVGLTDPSGDKVENTAVAPDDTDEGRRSVIYQIGFENVTERGFYSMALKQKTGDTESVLFAANADAFESDLERLDLLSMNAQFFNENVKLLSASDLSGEVDSRTSTGMWPRILLLLALVLGVEQFLGWMFGRKR